MQRNVGGLDRIIRGVLGIWLVVFALASLFDGQRLKGVVLGVAGLGLLHNSATGFCGANRLFGVDTTREGDGNVETESCSRSRLASFNPF